MEYRTAGESHGQALLAVVEGLPAAVALSTAEIADELARRRLGYGRGARMQLEKDEVTILSGVRHGYSLGSPIAIQIANTEWPKWSQAMSPDLVAGGDADELTRPRPGHADLPGIEKYGFSNARPVLERASARETAARVAAGLVAKCFLEQLAGVRVFSHVVALGGVAVTPGLLPEPSDLPLIDADPVRCFDAQASARMVATIEQAQSAGETLGGVVEVLAYGLPVGLGSHVSGKTRLDGRLAGALMGIPAIKGVEVGDGFAVASLPGSQAHDEIFAADGKLTRHTNHAGGVEGGITNGQVLRLRAAMKPIATVPNALQTVDLATGEPAPAHHQRSDITAVPAAGVVAEAEVAFVLAQACLEKFGGDSLPETKRNYLAYLETLR
ncbi:MAG: chorismate synthase [Propionibacteriaceae bacterium]|nr:chorismate synthase [Propionibacteriaceae bacterium]